MSSLQKETGDLVTWDKGKVEILQVLVFSGKCSTHTVQVSEGNGSEQENEGRV